MAHAYRNRDTTPREVVDDIIERIEKVDPQIDAFTAVDADNARAAADAALHRIENGEASPLCGVPVAVKELFAVNGMPWTGQSLIREGIAADRDAALVQQLRIGVISGDGQPVGTAQQAAYDSLLSSAAQRGAQLMPIAWSQSAHVYTAFRDLQAVDALATHRNVYQTWPTQPDRYGSDVRGRLEYAETVTTSMVRAAGVLTRNCAVTFDDLWSNLPA